MNQSQIIGINLTIDDLYALIVSAVQSVKAKEVPRPRLLTTEQV